MEKIALRISILITTLIFSCNTDPEGFTINGHVKGVSDGTIFYLMNWKDNAILDSSYVRNGTFSLNGRLSHPEKLLLHAKDSITNEFIYTNLLIGNENVTINAKKGDFPWNIDALGSESQDIAEKFNQIEWQRQEKNKHLREQFEKLPEENKDEERLNYQLKMASDSLDKIQVELIKENFNSYAALDILKYHKNHFSSPELAELYQKLSPELKESIPGKAIKIQIEYPAPKVGESYYDYTAVDQNGDTVSLSEINKKYLLLHFSSAACYPSQQSLPELRDVYERYNDKLEIIKISEDTGKEAWEKSIKRDSIIWINLWDGKGEYGDAVLKYGTTGTPNYILISPNKIVVEKWFGYSKGIIEEKLEKHLNNPDMAL